MPQGPSDSRISIILPVHNAGDILEESLTSIFNSDYENFEVILVDDVSTDNSVKIAEKFPVKLIRLDARKGAAAARNRGIEKSGGEIILFMDSDVVLKRDSISAIAKEMLRDKDIAGVSGIYSKYSRFKNFFSQYKHLVWHYRLIVGNAQDDSFTTAFMAVKRNAIKDQRFDESMPRASIEDIEFGRSLIAAGYRFFLDKSLEIEHAKKIGLGSFCRNQFLRSKDIMKTWLHKKAHSFYLAPSRKNTFAKRYLLRVPISFAMVLSLIVFLASGKSLFIYVSLIVFFFSVILEADFLKFCFREKRALFTMRCVAVYYLDGVISGTGVIAGGLEFLGGKIIK